MPFGPGRKWINQGVPSQIIGGWQISTLATLLSGPVYGVITQQNTCECFSAGPQRVNIARSPELPDGQRTVARWFDTSVFSQPVRALRSGMPPDLLDARPEPPTSTWAS